MMKIYKIKCPTCNSECYVFEVISYKQGDEIKIVCPYCYLYEK